MAAADSRARYFVGRRQRGRSASTAIADRRRARRRRLAVARRAAAGGADDRAARGRRAFRTSIVFAVVVGPGSFTGLRVGIATIQGLALARRQPVTPVSTFDALAWQARVHASDAIATWVDAHRGEVFATLFAPDGRPCSRPPPRVTPAATLDAWRDALAPFARVQFVGTAPSATATSSASGSAPGRSIGVGCPRCSPPRSAESPRRSRERAVRPHALVPLYVRRPDVELARDRRGGARADAGRDRARDATTPPTSTPSSRSKPSRSRTPGRARRSCGSCGTPTSRRSTCCGTTTGRCGRSASAG